MGVTGFDFNISIYNNQPETTVNIGEYN